MKSYMDSYERFSTATLFFFGYKLNSFVVLVRNE